MASWKFKGYVKDSEDDEEEERDVEEEGEAKGLESKPLQEAENTECPGTADAGDGGLFMRTEHCTESRKEVSCPVPPAPQACKPVSPTAQPLAVVIEHVEHESITTEPSYEVGSTHFNNGTAALAQIYSPEDVACDTAPRTEQNKEPVKGTPGRQADSADNRIGRDSSSQSVSPLSDMFYFQSTPATSPQVVDELKTPPGSKATPAPIASRRNSPGIIHQLSPDIVSQPSRYPARSLRKRNPIQLHPYLLEGERYRQTLKARGVKPLQIQESQAREPGSSQTSETQDVLFEVEEESQAPAAPNFANSSPPETPAVDDQDEFPDIDVILNGKLSSSIQKGFKRRKLAHFNGTRLIAQEKDNSHSTRYVKRGTDVQHEGNAHEQRDGDAVYDIPVSPACSGGKRQKGLRIATASGFKIPRGLSPIQKSSDEDISTQPLTKSLVLSEDSDSEQGGTGRQSSVREASFISGVISPEVTDASLASDLEILERDVFGASWLNLEIEKVGLGDHIHNDGGERSPTNICNHPGVARRVWRKPSEQRDLTDEKRTVISISDGTESSDSEYDRIIQSQSRPAHTEGHSLQLQLLPEYEDEEVEEDNRIDRMLSRSRKRHVSTGVESKKRQKRLTEVDWRSEKRSLKEKGPAIRGTRQTKFTKHRGTSTRQNRKQAGLKTRSPPKLSIVDVTNVNRSANVSLPPFIRVANRQARTRMDQARHSPTRKVFRLATRADTEEVQTVLREWTEGSIPVASRTHKQLPEMQTQRRSLSNIDGNEQRVSKDKCSNMRSERLIHNLKAAQHFQPPPEISPIHQVNSGEIVNKQRPGHTLRDWVSSHAVDRPREKSKNSLFLLPGQAAEAGSRPAHLESLKPIYRDRRRRHSLAPKLAKLDLAYGSKAHTAKYQRGEPRTPNLQPKPSNGTTENAVVQWLNSPQSSSLQARSAQAKLLHHRGRKRPPRHLDTEAVEYLHSADMSNISGVSQVLKAHFDDGSSDVLHNLGAFGTTYSVSFGILPLDAGTFFHESTFIGSLELSKVLRTTSYFDDTSNSGHVTVSLGQETFHWATWNDATYSSLGRVFEWICNQLDDLRDLGGESKPASGSYNITTYLRSVVLYFSNSITFADTVDRRSFARRCAQLVQRVIEVLSLNWHLIVANDAETSLSARIFTKAATLVFVLSFQLYQFCGHESLVSISGDFGSIVRLAAAQLFDCLKKGGLSPVRSFYLENRQLSKREKGVQSEDYVVEGFVVAMHLLRRLDIPQTSFWELFSASLKDIDIGTTSDAQKFEHLWRSLFTVLPLEDFDESGVIKRPGSHTWTMQESWNLPRALASRLFAVYKSSLGPPAPMLNSYCRAVLTRCHHLITQWGWCKCESIVGTLFDFFASNNLAHLKNEDSRGSATFLEELNHTPSLEVHPRDRCFHILLKIIAAGLKALGSVYPEKRIRNIVFRLIPNHGRQYPKEASVRQEDLDSLRNHHDLLSTLYWASPPSARPSTGIIRDLVDAEMSHREACHINIRAWSNLVRYQLTSGEAISLLNQFSAWHGGLTEKVLKQHSLARIEAEAQYAKMAIRGSKLSSELLRSTITNNQRQVEAVLNDSLLSMKSAMALCTCVEAATVLLNKASTAEVFVLFEPGNHRTCLVILNALLILREYIEKCTSFCSLLGIQQNSEESQDYGDWSAFGEAIAMPSVKQAAECLRDTAYESLTRLVSNAFGADIEPHQSFLHDLVLVWVSTCKMLVTADLKDWDDYTSDYSPNSWMSLRQTKQTRKFTPLYMSRVIEEDGDYYQGNKLRFQSYWIASLVERETMLKFQHLLTNTLLNADGDDPLLKNLPFCLNVRGGRFSITLRDFAERRLSLISSILANMQEYIGQTAVVSIDEVSARKKEYAQLLGKLMAAMRSNYEELQQNTLTTGAYVSFVHKVIEFLQQYTVDILPIDKFFTDSGTFPLPARDPTYVVGRLKNYGLRLGQAQTHLELISFIQSLSERAAFDNQQSCLSEQLLAAASGVFEDSNQHKPTLRAIFLRAIFPAYIQCAIQTAFGYILARPLLRASARLFDELLFDLDATNATCVSSVANILDVFLSSCHQSLEFVINRPGLLQNESTVNALTDLLYAVTATLQPLDYVYRISGQAKQAVGCVTFFLYFITHFDEIRNASIDGVTSYTAFADPPMLDTPPSADTGVYAYLRTSCSKDLATALHRNWVSQKGEHYYVRGSVRKHVAVQLGTYEEEMANLIRAFEEFGAVYEKMIGLGGYERKATRSKMGTTGTRKSKRLGLSVEDMLAYEAEVPDGGADELDLEMW